MMDRAVRLLVVLSVVMGLVVSSVQSQASEFSYQPLTGANDVSTTTDKDDVWQAIETALLRFQSPGRIWKIVNVFVSGEWGVGVIAPFDPNTQEYIPSGPQFALARNLDDAWNVTLPFDTHRSSTYNSWLVQIPNDLISMDDKVVLQRQPAPNVAALSTVSGYKLPWRNGLQAYLTSNASDHGYSALDFDIQGSGTSGDVVAAKSGTVKFRKDTSATQCVWNGSSWSCRWQYANIVVVEHSSTEYSWYMHLAPGSIPSNIQEGTYINQGGKIGVEGRTGWSTDVHLHFQVATTYGCCNGSGDTRVPYWPSSFQQVDFAEYNWNDIQSYGWKTSQNGGGSPPPPCPSSGGVILYKHANYDCGGEEEGSGYVQRTSTGWQNVPGSFNDHASSIKVPSGWSVRLYEHNDRGGGWACRTENDRDFWGDNFNNDAPLNGSGSGEGVSSFEVFNSPNCGQPSNRSPNAPTLLRPANGHPAINDAPNLCWQNNGDPDGDTVWFRVEVRGDHSADSDWMMPPDPTCWRPSTLNHQYGNYNWKVRVRDSQGAEAESGVWNFSIQPPPNNPPSISFNTANGDGSNRIESRDRNWTFQGTASDSDGYINRIDFRCDNCDNSGSGPSSTTGNNWSLTRNDMAGQNDVYFRAYDNEGADTSSRHLDLRIDLAAPSTGHDLSGTSGKNGWYISPVEVHLHANDGNTGGACVGVDEIRYRRRLDSNEWGDWLTPDGNDVRFPADEDGSHTVEYYAVDKVGNTESTRSVTFKIDTTPPTAPGAATETHGAISGQWQRDWNDPNFTWVPASDATSDLWYYRVDWDDTLQVDTVRF